MDRIALLAVWVFAFSGVVPKLPLLAGRIQSPDGQDRLSANQKALLDLEHDWARALERGDVKVLDRIVADDFVDSNYLGGFVTKGQMFAPGGAEKRPRRLNHLEQMHARAYGDAGIVNGINMVTDQYGKFLRRVRFTDVFIKQNGRWQAVSAQETVVIMP